MHSAKFKLDVCLGPEVMGSNSLVLTPAPPLPMLARSGGLVALAFLATNSNSAGQGS